MGSGNAGNGRIRGTQLLELRGNFSEFELDPEGTALSGFAIDNKLTVHQVEQLPGND